MIKNLAEQQKSAVNSLFAQKLTHSLGQLNIKPSPHAVAKAINEHYKLAIAKPHTVRKWLLGQTQPKSETLLLLANWLNVAPKDLIASPKVSSATINRVSFEFDFTDQEVISKYLAMTVKQKVTVRLLIDAIGDIDK